MILILIVVTLIDYRCVLYNLWLILILITYSLLLLCIIYPFIDTNYSILTFTTAEHYLTFVDTNIGHLKLILRYLGSLKAIIDATPKCMTGMKLLEGTEKCHFN